MENTLTQNIPKYFRTSDKRFWLFSFITLGGYHIYWSYRNWDAIKVFDKSEIMPFWRGVFSILFMLPLAKRMANDIKGNDSNEYGTFSWIFFSYILFLNVLAFSSSRINISYWSNVSYLFEVIILFFFQNIISSGEKVVLNKKIARGEIIAVVFFTLITLFQFLHTLKIINLDI